MKLVTMTCADCGARWESNDMQDVMLHVLGGDGDVLCAKCAETNHGEDFTVSRPYVPKVKMTPELHAQMVRLGYDDPTELPCGCRLGFCTHRQNRPRGI